MPFTEQLTQALTFSNILAPSNQASTTPALTGSLDMSNLRRAIGHVVAGVLGTNANVQFYLQSSNTAGGSYANCSSTNAVQTLTSANTQGTIEVRADQLPTGNRFVKLAVLVNTNDSFVTGILIGGESAYKPASQFNWTSNGTFINQSVL